MEDISIFQDKTISPEEKDLANALAETYPLWTEIQNMLYELYPEGMAEWNYPERGYFMVAFVFGQKAVDPILPNIRKLIEIKLKN